MYQKFRSLTFKLSLILSFSISSIVMANSNSYCGDVETFTFYRDKNFIEVDVPNERRLRMMAGAFSSKISITDYNEYVLSTKWEIIGKPGCFTLTKEVFYNWKGYQGSVDNVVVNGNIIEGKSGGYYPLLYCHELEIGGRRSDHGRVMEKEARHNALFACKSEGYRSCKKVSSACIRTASGSTWKFIMEGQ